MYVSFREGSRGKQTNSILLEKKRQHCTKTVFIFCFPDPILEKQKQKTWDLSKVIVVFPTLQLMGKQKHNDKGPKVAPFR